MSCVWTDKVGCEELCYFYNPVSIFTGGMDWNFFDEKCGPLAYIGDEVSVTYTTFPAGSVVYIEIIVYIPNSYPTSIYEELHVNSTIINRTGFGDAYELSMGLEFIDRIVGTNYYRYGKSVAIDNVANFFGYNLAYSFAYNNGEGYVHDGSYDYLAGVFIYDVLFGNYLPNTDIWVGGSAPTIPGSYLNPVVTTENRHPPIGTNIYVNNITPCAG